jgi:hypothetical protein
MNHPSMTTRPGIPHAAPTDPDLVDRLIRLRTILPLIATDLATARRHTHTLQLENQRLTARITELESKLGNHTTSDRTDPQSRSTSRFAENTV